MLETEGSKGFRAISGRTMAAVLIAEPACAQDYTRRLVNNRVSGFSKKGQKFDGPRT